MPRKSSSRRGFRIGRSITGLGAFAVRSYKKGDFIARYWGRRIPTAIADDLDSKYMFEINSRWTIDGSTRRNTARYINHACRPNAESDVLRGGKVIIRAIKRIEPGDEITYDYGTDYFKNIITPARCRCAHCRRKRSEARKEAARKAARKAARRKALAKRNGAHAGLNGAGRRRGDPAVQVGSRYSDVRASRASTDDRATSQ